MLYSYAPTSDASNNEVLSSVAHDEGMIVVTSSSNLYRYNGKEEQQIAGTELAVLDYGARTYDPWLSRWTSIDPLAEKCIRKKRMTKSPSNPVKSLLISPVRLQVQLGSLLRSHRKALHCQ